MSPLGEETWPDVDVIDMRRTTGACYSPNTAQSTGNDQRGTHTSYPRVRPLQERGCPARVENNVEDEPSWYAIN
jgi:hypothetical protein